MCMQVRKQQLELDMEQQTGSKSGFGTNQVLEPNRFQSPFLFNFYAEYTIQNAGVDEAQARIKIARNQ